MQDYCLYNKLLWYTTHSCIYWTYLSCMTIIPLSTTFGLCLSRCITHYFPMQYITFVGVYDRLHRYHTYMAVSNTLLAVGLYKATFYSSIYQISLCIEVLPTSIQYSHAWVISWQILTYLLGDHQWPKDKTTCIYVNLYASEYIYVNLYAGIVHLSTSF